MGRGGRPSCKNFMSTSMTVLPWYFTTHFSELVNSPTTVASTPLRCMRLEKAFQLFFGTESVMRSCDSLIHVCHGSRPGYFHGTLSRSTVQPPHSLAISAMEQLKPPAPLSVMLLYKPRSLASLTIASLIFFCVMGSPICTA